jgi:single-stranded-DNA-specific exonuclease
VDGITGTAILYEILKATGVKVVPVLPNRGTGYGLNVKLMSLFSKYADLLITVDNGTSAVREIDASNMDVIVIDHHNVPEEIPSRATLINPRLSEDIPKDLRELSSSAMCFYIGAVLVRRLGLDIDIRKFLDLVAFGTVGDVMPMNRTNRILVTKGLKVAESVLKGVVDKPGVKALLSLSRVKDRVSAKDVAYSIAPRINAPGRIGNPKLSLFLLTEKDPTRARLLAKKIEAVNFKRKVITDKVFKEAYPRALDSRDRNFITLWDRRWHVGVLGIVAGRLSNLLGKPVAVLSKGKTHSVGSVRSVEGIDIYRGLKELSHMFLKWGGHMQAAGLTLESELLESFSEKAEEVFSHVPKEPPPLYIDMELPLSNIDEKVVDDVRKLEPYGEGNPLPVFLSEELTLDRIWKGNGRSRLRFGKYDILCWNPSLTEKLKVGNRVRIAYSIADGDLILVDVEDKDGAG